MKDLNGFYAALEKAADKNNGSVFCIQGRHSGKSFALQTFRELLTVAEALKAGRTITTINEQVVNVVTSYEIPVKPDGIGWIIDPAICPETAREFQNYKYERTEREVRNMMNVQRAKELMQIERECVTRADACVRDCAQCDLVQQNTSELLEAYDFVLAVLETISKWEDDGK